MRFIDVVACLEAMPDPLPARAENLMPVLTGGGALRRPQTPPPGRPGRPAAVLVLVYPDASGLARVVLTERASRDGYHSGEVSFPGGKAEPEDPDLGRDRAARSDRGDRPRSRRGRGPAAGRLERFWIPVSDFQVTPIVAVAPERPTLVAAPAEVARIIEPPVSRFLPDAPIAIVERRSGGGRCATARTRSTACPSGARPPASSASSVPSSPTSDR